MMNTLTLKIPKSLEDALMTASERRRVSKSALVREALEKALAGELRQAGTSGAWTSRWRGTLRDGRQAADDLRVAHILAKHAR